MILYLSQSPGFRRSEFAGYRSSGSVEPSERVLFQLSFLRFCLNGILSISHSSSINLWLPHHGVYNLRCSIRLSYHSINPSFPKHMLHKVISTQKMETLHGRTHKSGTCNRFIKTCILRREFLDRAGANGQLQVEILTSNDIYVDRSYSSLY